MIWRRRPHFRIGRAHYDRDEFQPALASFETLLGAGNNEAEDGVLQVSPELAEVAANLILDIYNYRKDWRKIIERARGFVEDPRFKDNRGFIEKTTELADGASFKVRSLDLAGKPHEEVAEGYLTYVRENPKSRWADRAMFNAAVHYEKGGETTVRWRLVDSLLLTFRRVDWWGGWIFSWRMRG